MSASSVACPPGTATDECVVLRHVKRDTYERLLSDEKRQIPPISYDQGVLELVTPSISHEEEVSTIAEIIQISAALLGISIRSVASTTFKRHDTERGFEAGAISYVQCEEPIRGLREADLLVDPPPELVLEMALSRSAVNQLAAEPEMPACRLPGPRRQAVRDTGARHRSRRGHGAAHRPQRRSGGHRQRQRVAPGRGRSAPALHAHEVPDVRAFSGFRAGEGATFDLETWWGADDEPVRASAVRGRLRFQVGRSTG